MNNNHRDFYWRYQQWLSLQPVEFIEYMTDLIRGKNGYISLGEVMDCGEIADKAKSIGDLFDVKD